VTLVRVAVAGAVLETVGWLFASLLTGPDAWRHDISTMSAVGGDHAWLVLAGEAGLTVAILVLAALIHASDLRGDHAPVGTVLLTVAGLGFGVQALAREGGSLEATHGPAAVLGVLALASAPLALAVPFRASPAHRELGTWSVLAAGLGMVLFAGAMAPGLAGGLSQRGAALVLTGWVALAAVRVSGPAVSTFPKVPREDRLPR
jgi:hypothetical protein